MEIQALVARNIRRLRVAKGISQDELALTAGIERSYVGHLERGIKNPTVVTLSKLADALECEVSEFFRSARRHESPPDTLKPGRKKK